MKAPAWLKSIRLPDVSGFGRARLVALDFNGFVLRAALVEARRGEPRFVATAESRLQPAAEALREALEALRARAGRLPRTCVLATAQMLGLEIRLPVAPAKPRKRAQMLELARWELEPLAGQASLQWNMGAVLAGLGYLAPAQRLDVVAEQRRSAGHALRFGELARDFGFIGDEQLARAVAAQKQLQGSSADFDVGYGAMDGEPRDGAWPWLGVAIDRQVREQWFEACRAAGMRLAWLYPRNGLSALALIDGGELDADGVEVRGEAIVSWSCRDGRLTTLVQDSRPETAAEPAEVLALLAGPPESAAAAYQYHIDNAEPGLAPAFSAAWGGRAVAAAPGGLEAEWVPLHGLAAHALGLRGAAVCARMKGRERPPPWRHPEFKRVLVPALAVLAAGGGAAHLQYRLANGEARLARIEKDFRREAEEQKQNQAAQAESEKLGRDLEALRARARELEQRERLLDDKLLGRLDEVPALLRTLAATIGPAAVLESVREAGRQEGFHVTAWGMREDALLEFARNAQEKLAALKLGVIGTEFATAEGRTGLPGYRVGFWVVRDADAMLRSASAPRVQPSENKGSGKAAQR